MKKFLIIAMMLVLTFSCLSLVKADLLPPTITLNVKVDPISITSSNVTYTAKITYLPPIWSNAIAMNFYCNGVRVGRSNIDLKTLTAVFKFAQKSGKYTAVAALEDTPQPVKSNPVTYIVP